MIRQRWRSRNGRFRFYKIGLWAFYGAKRIYRGTEVFGGMDNFMDSRDPNVGKPTNGEPLLIYRTELGRTFGVGMRFNLADEESNGNQRRKPPRRGNPEDAPDESAWPLQLSALRFKDNLMNGSNNVRVWLCDCGRIHLETKHCRMSLMPFEFLSLLRCARDKDGAGVGAPQQPSYLDEACTKTMASRVVQGQLHNQSDKIPACREASTVAA